MILAALALIAAQAAPAAEQSDPLANMAPASADAIRAGAKACVGSTVDVAGQDARLKGWTDAATDQTKVHTDGRIVQRDNVLVIVKPGLDGGCVVMAKLDPGFDKAAFYTALGKDLGVKIVTDPASPVTELPRDELLVTNITTDPGNSMAMLIVGNSRGKAMQNKGK